MGHPYRLLFTIRWPSWPCSSVVKQPVGGAVFVSLSWLSSRPSQAHVDAAAIAALDRDAVCCVTVATPAIIARRQPSIWQIRAYVDACIAVTIAVFDCGAVCCVTVAIAAVNVRRRPSIRQFRACADA